MGTRERTQLTSPGATKPLPDMLNLHEKPHLFFAFALGVEW
jgi:hypothetical protein